MNSGLIQCELEPIISHLAVVRAHIQNMNLQTSGIEASGCPERSGGTFYLNSLIWGDLLLSVSLRYLAAATVFDNCADGKSVFFRGTDQF